MIFWSRTRREIERDKLCEFLNTEWPGSDGDALNKSVGNFPICFIDISQCTLICLFKCVWYFIQSMPDPPWEAAAKVEQLAMDPSEPK